VTGLGLSGGWAEYLDHPASDAEAAESCLHPAREEPCIPVARPGQRDAPESQGFAGRRKDSPSRRLPGGRGGTKEPKKCFVIRGGGETENHFECLWDLFRSIPSSRPRAPAALALVTLAAVH
jgi:MCRA family